MRATHDIDRHRDDVEATARVLQPAPFQIVLRQAREPALLVPRHRGRRRIAPRRAPALDLDEDDDVAVTAHEIELAVAEADVALEDAKAGAREIIGRRVFGVSADGVAGIDSPVHSAGIPW